jgi:hypothetical protein
MTLFLRADHATASESGLKGLSYKIAIDRPIPLRYYSSARPDSIIKKGHTAGMPCRKRLSPAVLCNAVFSC